MIKADAYETSVENGLVFANRTLSEKDKNATIIDKVCEIAPGQWYGVQKIL